MLGLTFQIELCIGRDQTPVPDHENPRAGLDEMRVMGGGNHDCAGPRPCAQDLAQMVGGLTVQMGRGFIKDEQDRMTLERAGQSNELCLSR